MLLPLENLLSLDLKLGGTRDLSLLPRIGRLRYLELWQIRGLDNLGPVGEVVTLQHLFLQSLPRVGLLPDFSRLTRLRRVVLDNMKGVADLAPWQPLRHWNSYSSSTCVTSLRSSWGARPIIQRLARRPSVWAA